jgi:acyl-CoA thioester hydrolase
MSTTSTSAVRVRYGETDQMGLAYHANYLVWCEIGRTDFMRQLGTTYAEIEGQGFFLAVAEASIRFAAPAHYDDLLTIETCVVSARSRTITFAYRIRRDSPDPADLATATTTLVATGRDGTPRRLPASILDLFLDAL